MIQAVLWDVDGTLLDSEPLHLEALSALYARYGHRLDEGHHRRILGLPAAEIHALLGGELPLPLDVEGWRSAWADHYVAIVGRARPRLGAVELVGRLHGLGVRQGCVSNGPRRIVDANLRALGLDHALGFSISLDDVVRGKPHPDPYLAAAARLGVPPSACIAIEDSPVGARSAKAAGMLTIAWPQSADLAFDRVDHLVHDLHALDWPALCGRGG